MKFMPGSFEVKKDSFSYAFNEDVRITIFEKAVTIHTDYTPSVLSHFIHDCNNYLNSIGKLGCLSQFDKYYIEPADIKSSSVNKDKQHMHLKYANLINSDHIIKVCEMLEYTDCITSIQKETFLERAKIWSKTATVENMVKPFEVILKDLFVLEEALKKKGIYLSNTDNDSFTLPKAIESSEEPSISPKALHSMMIKYGWETPDEDKVNQEQPSNDNDKPLNLNSDVHSVSTEDVKKLSYKKILISGNKNTIFGKNASLLVINTLNSNEVNFNEAETMGPYNQPIATHTNQANNDEAPKVKIKNKQQSSDCSDSSASYDPSGVSLSGIVYSDFIDPEESTKNLYKPLSLS